MIYPFIEAWITGDKREHHVLDRPRNAPTRTAIGAAGVTFYAALWAAASSDIIATHFHVTMEGVIHALQASRSSDRSSPTSSPSASAWPCRRRTARSCCTATSPDASSGSPAASTSRCTSRVDEYERWKLVDYNDYKPLMIRPNAKGRITVGQHDACRPLPLVLRGPHLAGQPRRSSSSRTAITTRHVQLQIGHRCPSRLCRSGCGARTVFCPSCPAARWCWPARHGHAFDVNKRGFRSVLKGSRGLIGDSAGMLEARDRSWPPAGSSPLRSALAHAGERRGPDPRARHRLRHRLLPARRAGPQPRRSRPRRGPLPRRRGPNRARHGRR